MSPTAEQVRAAREAAGLTQSQAAELCHRKLRAWQYAESGQAALDAAAWELFQLKTDQHPTARIALRRHRGE
jgi:DNA-binding transcriptional regulator YiaG